ERPIAPRFLAEWPVHAPHLVRHRGAVQPVRVILFLAEPQRPFKEPGRQLLRVLGIELNLVDYLGRWPRGSSRTPRGRGAGGLATLRLRAGRRRGPRRRGVGG